MRGIRAGLAAAGVVIGLTACGGAAPDGAAPGGAGTSEAPAGGDCAAVREYAMGLRFQQQSAEVGALQRQAYRLATERLDAAVERGGAEKPLAVVSDLDETAIDNTRLLARDLEDCHDYTAWDTWKDWEKTGNPTLVPGAKEFFDHAASRGVAVYYVSDRNEENKGPTLATLRGLGLPGVDDEHVQLLGPPKSERRAAIAAHHTIALQLGDTLADFDGFYEDAEVPAQRDRVSRDQARFGVDWIVFPNASYGSWRKSELAPWQP
ncbi:5'-nucleotidase, lipoprotein e(P4) family [Tsukamurella sp. 1534]|uniref:5'-nucleotidase, lipoprotein e(P4) family n=1 Tax=Tsukamurella sp. 1534 TaxID=1151061 RepID=UPI0002D25C57|nr:HAD family acid phosphatase [Tsukamurella sp. 1534]